MKKLSVDWRFYVGIVGALIIVVALYCLFPVSSFFLLKSELKNLMPDQEQGRFIVIYLMIPLSVLGLFAFIRFTITYLGYAISIDSIRKQLQKCQQFDWKNFCRTCNHKILIDFGWNIANSANCFIPVKFGMSTDAHYAFDSDDSARRKACRESISQTFSNRRGVIPDIVFALRNYHMNPHTQTKIQDVIDNAIAKYERQFEAYIRWMTFFANTLVVLGLLGSFIGVNDAIKELNSLTVVNDTSMRVPESPQPKVEKVNSLPGSNGERFTASNQKVNNDNKESVLVDQMKNILAGLSTTFRCSIWGIILMIPTMLVLAYSNSGHQHLFGQIDDIAKNQLSYVFDLGVTGVQSLTKDLMKASDHILNLKKEVTELKTCFTSFTGVMSKLENNVKNFHQQVNFDIKSNTDQLSSFVNTFKKEISAMYANNSNILQEFNNKLTGMMGAISQLGTTNSSLDAGITSLNGQLPNLKTTIDGLASQNQQVFPVLQKNLTQNSTISQEIVAGLRDLNEVRKELQGLIKEAHAIPQQLQQREQHITELFKKQFETFISNENLTRKQNERILQDISSTMGGAAEGISQVGDQLMETQRVAIKEYSEETTRILGELLSQYQTQLEATMERIGKLPSTVTRLELLVKELTMSTNILIPPTSEHSRMV